MKYSQDALNEMASKIDLLDYMGRTVEFTKHSGNTHFCLCPFHNEDTSSLAVNEDDQFWHCFGCNRSGNIYTWIQLTEHLTFDQAVQKVADLTDSDIQEYIESESVNFYKLINKITKSTKEPSVDRPILDIEKDYNQKYRDEVPQEWIDEGIPAEEMKKYEIRIDPTSNRIVYPVRDAEFRMIGVKGRTRFKNYKDLGIMKYMNYNSIKTLNYFTGAMQADPYIKESGEIIILEGLKSVMKVDQWGYHNAVSAETSVLNEYQIELLIKMQVKNVVIAFDKDVGIKKIQGCVKMLKKFTNCYAVIDKWRLLKDKESPPDEGREVWETLYSRRIRI